MSQVKPSGQSGTKGGSSVGFQRVISGLSEGYQRVISGLSHMGPKAIFFVTKKAKKLH